MAILRRVPSRSQIGFTLIETTIAVAIFAALVIASVAGLAHRAGEFEVDRSQVAAFLVMAKAHAATIGDGSSSTGATVVASYETSPFASTTLTLYDGRPFGGTPIARSPRVAAVRVPGQLALASPGPVTTPGQFAIFFGTSGSTTALDRYVVNQTPVLAEPPCDLRAGLQLPFTEGATSNAIQVSCETGEVVPDASAPNQRRATLQQGSAS